MISVGQKLDRTSIIEVLTPFVPVFLKMNSSFSGSISEQEIQCLKSVKPFASVA